MQRELFQSVKKHVQQGTDKRAAGEPEEQRSGGKETALAPLLGELSRKRLRGRHALKSAIR